MAQLPGAGKINWLLLWRWVRPLHPTSDLFMTLKKSDGEVPVMQELWGMPSLPGPLWPRVVAPDRVLSMGQIELNYVLMQNWIVWNRTVYMYKNQLGKPNQIYTLALIAYNGWYTIKPNQHFGINNLQWLIYHQTKPNQTKPNQTLALIT